MDAIEWIDRTGDILSPFVSVMKVSDEDQWREWGTHVRQTLRQDGILIPVPDSYRDWIEWAFRFNQVIALL